MTTTTALRAMGAVSVGCGMRSPPHAQRPSSESDQSHEAGNPLGRKKGVRNGVLLK
jgi:hypothetical protein